ncbi:MAG TPA: hypothetical protein VHI52_21160, partial [Verrucomicrobiae bacterium]|nr:hypothetical protein [Verrucomicrobiae bacterium]
MKSFVKGVTDAATNAEQAFEKAVTKAAQHLADPKSVPQSDVDDAWREFRETCKKIETDTSEAARHEIKDHITLKEAGELIEDEWVKAKQLADKGIKAAPKAWNWIKTALCVAGAGIAAVSFGLLHPPAAYDKGLAARGIVNQN